jgi:hypothetical protein
MKKKTKRLLFSLFLILGLGVMLFPGAQNNEVKAQSGEWCLDFSPIGEPCSGVPIDCFCLDPIVVQDK